jgi:hypothetical protein
MVGMDSWCPSCGYSVEPGTRFCNGCGHQFAAAAQSGAGPAPSPTVTTQSLSAPFLGSPTQVSAPPPPAAGSRMSWPPPPGGQQDWPASRRGAAASEPTSEQAPISDTVERMLRPQGLFQNQQPRPVDWQPAPAYPPAPAGYPQGGGQYPAGGGYQGAATGYQQAAPPQWPQAPGGAPPAGHGASGGPGAGYPAGGQFPPAPAPNGGYQGPYQNGQYGQGQYGQGQYGQGQFPTGVQYGPDGLPLGDGSGSQGDGRPLYKRPLVLGAVAGGAALIVAIALALSSHGNSPSASTGPSTPASGSPTATSSASATAKTQHEAAAALSTLLSQSGGDRADVNAAFTNVSTCGKDLAKDATVFGKAAANRRILLAKLAKLPGRTALSPEMLTDLTKAWQASATVDADLAKWATDEAGHCNKKHVTKDKNYIAATGPVDGQATVNKNAFVELWNPLAKKNGLAKVQPTQI